MRPTLILLFAAGFGLTLCMPAFAGADEIKCLTGNAERRTDNMPVKGTYSVFKPGMPVPGWPKGPAQQKVPFRKGLLTDGRELTFLEWDDSAFGKLGRDFVVDLGKEYYIDRVAVYGKGNRLTGGTLFLKQADTLSVPVGKYGVDDFPAPVDRRRGRYYAVLFPETGAVARWVRVNVRGNHNPRVAELQVWGRAASDADQRPLKPLLPYDPDNLVDPKPVEQVAPLKGLDAIVPRPQRIKKSPGTCLDPMKLVHARGGVRQIEKAVSDAAWETPGGYHLVIRTDSVRLAGHGPTGIRNGLTTLAMLTAKDGRAPCGEIEDWPAFPFRAVRKAPPNKADQDFNRAYVKVIGDLKYNVVIHEGLDWAVNFNTWKTKYSKALSVEELRQAIKQKQQAGLRVIGGWPIAPAKWASYLGDPKLVEGRPGEVYLENGRIQLKKYDGEVLRKLSRLNACPLQPENLTTFKKMVDELAGIYADEYFFGGVDEPLQWYHGSRWGCCRLCRDKDPVELMGEWVEACSAHIRKKHKKIHMYQTTILLKEHQGEEPGYPGGPDIPMYKIISRMPKERTALLNWSYGPWKRAHDAPDSSGLNRYLASQGFSRIIQNVGYTDASFAICNFTTWAGKQGADFIGASVANYVGQSPLKMKHGFKFLDYVITAEELWSPGRPAPGTPAFGSQVIHGLEYARETIEGVQLPSRYAQPRDFFTVDLSAHVNRSSVDLRAYDGRGWVDLGPGMDLRGLPSGRQELCGHVFRLPDPGTDAGKVCIMLAGPKTASSLPSEIKGIQVNRRAASLQFLHCLTEGLERRVTIPAFTYRMHYQDKTHADFPVRNRIEIMEWQDRSNRGSGKMRVGWFLYGARPAWLGSSASGRRLILYSAEWVNPQPQKAIVSVDMILPDSSPAAGAALLGLSGVAAD